MKTILVPVDFSDYSKKALEVALHIGCKTQATLLVFHGYSANITADLLYPSVSSPVIGNDLEEKNSILLHEFIEPILRQKCANGETVNVKKIIKVGFEANDLEKLVQKYGVDLVVMGTKGASGIEEMLLGSTTAHSIEHLSCSILAVPQNSSLSLDKILYASNFEQEDIILLDRILIFAQIFGAELHCLHIINSEKNWEMEERTLKTLAQTYKYHQNIYFHSLEAANTLTAIEHYATAKNIGLIGVYNKKRAFWEQIFHRSLSKRLVMESQIPVLILKHNQ